MLGHSFFVLRVQRILCVFAWRGYLKKLACWDNGKSSSNSTLLDWRGRMQTLKLFHWLFGDDGLKVIYYCHWKDLGLKRLAIDFLKNYWAQPWWVTAHHISGKLMFVSLSWESRIDVEHRVYLSWLCNCWGQIKFWLHYRLCIGRTWRWLINYFNILFSLFFHCSYNLIDVRLIQNSLLLLNFFFTLLGKWIVL